MSKKKEAEAGEFPQVIQAFNNTRIANATHANVQLPNKAAIINGTSTQAEGDKIHLDTSPVKTSTGIPAGGGDGEVQSWVKEDGTSPIIEWRWLVDEKEASNSAEMPDPFHLGSYEDNGGCTPSLKLLAPVGEGRHEVKAFPFVRPEYNGGAGVEGKPVVWYCD